MGVVIDQQDNPRYKNPYIFVYKRGPQLNPLILGRNIRSRYGGKQQQSLDKPIIDGKKQYTNVYS
jgi:hypothetical protein